MAFFFGFIWFINLLAQFRLSDLKYQPNYWWLSFYPLPALIEQAISLCAALVFIAYAIAPPSSGWRRRATRMTVELLWVLTAWNLINFYSNVFRGRFHTSFPLPFPVFIAAGLLIIWLRAGVERPAKGWLPWAMAALMIAVAGMVFPLLQILCFGPVDHRKAAESQIAHTGMAGAEFRKGGVAVLFSSGEAGSIVLRDRVKTAADLYHANIISKVFASSPKRSENGARDDAAAIRALALAAGIPAQDIETQSTGIGVEETVRAACLKYQKEEFLILPITDYDQLPRIDMLFAQEGRTVYPVPVANHSNVSASEVMRQVPLLWQAWFAPLGR